MSVKKFRDIFIAFTLAAVCSVGVAFANWQTGEGGGPNYASASFNGTSTDPVARIGTTYYASINKAIDDGVLGMCYPSTYLHEYDGTVASIAQDNTNAWVDPNVLTISYASASTSYVPSGSYTTGLPTNAGYYVVKIAATNGYATTHTINCRISPKVIYIKDTCSYALDYDSSARTSATLINAVTNLQFTDNQTTQATYSFNSYVIAGIDNGMYYYPNSAISSSQSAIYSAFVNKCNSAGMLTAPQSGVTNVVGSTYAVTVASTNSNYEIGNRCILKYKTALVGSTYYTVEDAINLSGTTVVTFAGDSTNTTSYVATCFCALTDENPYSQTRSYALAKNMVVNFQSGTTETYTGTTSFTATATYNVYSTLIIPSNVSLTVNSGKTLTVNATIGYTQPATSATMTRGVILNEGTITVNGYFKSYGFTKGNGYVIAENGSQITDVLRTYDWPGGNTANACNNNNCMPINSWSIHNISCKTKLKYGTKLYGEYYGYEGSAVASALIVSSSTSDNCLFINKDSSSYIIKKAINADISPNSTALMDINGSNQLNALNGTVGQKDIIELYGNFSDAAFKLNVTISGVSATIAASTSKGFPMGFCSVYLKNSDEDVPNSSFASTLSLSKSDFIFLPGTKLVVDSGTTLTTSSGADLIFETWSHSSSAEEGSYASFKNQCKDKVDAKLVLNGTFNANGSVAGNVVTESTSAKLVAGASSGFKAVTFCVLNKAIGASSSGNVAYKISNMYSMAHINSSTATTNFVASNTYTTAYDSANQTYYFVGTAGTVTSLSGTLANDGITVSSTCVVKGTLITLADGTQKPIEELHSGDMVKAFNYLTGAFEDVMVGFVVNHGYGENIVIKAQFDNGAYLEMINSHGLYDYDSRELVTFDSTHGEEYIGRRFVMENNGEISYATLIGLEYETRYCEAWSIFTFGTLNAVTNGLLSTNGALPLAQLMIPLNNEFAYDEETLNELISEFGYATYEEWSNYLDEATFNAFNFEYVNIYIGLGITTREEIIWWINLFYQLMETGFVQ